MYFLGKYAVNQIVGYTVRNYGYKYLSLFANKFKAKAKIGSGQQAVNIEINYETLREEMLTILNEKQKVIVRDLNKYTSIDDTNKSNYKYIDKVGDLVLFNAILEETKEKTIIAIFNDYLNENGFGLTQDDIEITIINNSTSNLKLLRTYLENLKPSLKPDEQADLVNESMVMLLEFIEHNFKITNWAKFKEWVFKSC